MNQSFLAHHRVIVLTDGASCADIPTEDFNVATLVIEPPADGGPIVVHKDRYALFAEQPCGFVQTPQRLITVYDWLKALDHHRPAHLNIEQLLVSLLTHVRTERQTDESLTEEQLLERIDTCGVEAGSSWHHGRTGTRYLVLDVGVQEASLEPVVTYCRVDDKRTPTFARPVSEFLERFEKHS